MIGVPEIEFSSLEINGFGGAPLPNRLLRLKGATPPALGVIFPGLRYSCDMPLLYYTTRLLLRSGIDVLQVQRDYTQPAYQSAHRLEQLQMLGQDAQAAIAGGLAQGGYSRLVLVGKSIGTLVLAYLGSSLSQPPFVSVWLTPLLDQPLLVEAACSSTAPGLFVAGSGDALYDPAALERIRFTAQAEVQVFPGADHSLELPSDLPGSLAILGEYLQGLGSFLDRNLNHP